MTQTQQQKYQFDYAYQVDILKVCVQDGDFLKNYPDTIQPNFFTIEHLTIMAQLVLEFFKNYRESPSYHHIRNEAATYVAKFSVQPEIQANIYGTIDQIYREAPVNAQAVRDSVTTFARRQSIIRGLSEATSVLSTGGDLDKIAEIVQRSSIVGSRNKKGLDFFKDAHNLHTMISSDRGYNPEFKIKTGLKQIDDATFGGMGPGQIWVVGAKPKGGKTTLMVNIAASALYQGKRVYHYSFGDMNELDVMIKYTQRVSGLTVEQVLMSRKYEGAIDQLRRATPSTELQIIYDSPGKMDVDDLKTDLGLRISQTGVKPQLLVVDYANKMKQKSIDNSYRSMSLIYEGLKELGDVYGCAVLTGVQLRRDAKRDDGAPEDVAESWLQIADADAFILINQNAQESNNGRARLSMPIIRRGKEVPTYPVQFLKTVARFRDI